MALKKVTTATVIAGKSGTDNSLPVLSGDINPVIDAVNDLIDGDVSMTDLDLAGTLNVDGVITQTLTTDSTSGTTGATKLDGGLGVAKAIFAGTTVNAGTSATVGTTLGVGTSMTVGTDITGLKEVDHVVTVATTTTAATVGGKITVKGATGATSGAGGAAELIGGAAGATAGATGGAVTITSGAEGAGLGVTGAINITTPNATGGVGGNITLLPGTGSTTTVASVIVAGTNIIHKPTGAPFFLIGTTASDGAFAKSIVGGYVEVRGATGNVQLPTGAMITTAVGTVTAGVSFLCVFNAIGATPMTAGNTATITTNTNAVLDASLDQDIVTVTSTSNVNIGVFRFTFDSADWIVSRA